MERHLASGLYLINEPAETDQKLVDVDVDVGHKRNKRSLSVIRKGTGVNLDYG